MTAFVVASGWATARPTLRVADAGPVVLRGAGFLPGEHVRVTVVAGPKHAAKRLTARPAGTFTVRFASLSAGACAAFGATAIGDKGSRAIYKRSPGMCPAP
jgi:hypothetical protein